MEEIDDKIRILDEILEVTDIMINALKVDDLDIFFNELERRHLLMISFDELDGTSDKEKNKLYYDRLIQLRELENQLELGFADCKNRMQTSFEDVKLKLNKLRFQKKINGDYLGIKAISAGSYFDSKK